MMYDSILARSFSRHEQKKLGYGALVACFLLALSICTVFKPYLGPNIPMMNLRLSMDTISPRHMVGHIRQWINYPNSQNMNLVIETNSSQEIGDDKLVLVNEAITREGIEGDRMQSGNETSRSQKVEGEKMISVNETASRSQRIEDGKMLSGNESTRRSKEVEGQEMVEANDTSRSREIEGDELLSVNGAESSQEIVQENAAQMMEPVCNFTEPRTDFCEINGDIRVDAKSSTVFFASSQTGILAKNSTSWNIRPYARKTDKTAMNIVRKWSIKPAYKEIPQCSQHHNVPAILFSIGGYAGNHFHAFTDVIIPLFLTSQQFNGEVKFLISNSYPSWTTKFQSILEGLSRYKLINIDKEEEIHCFPSLILGLKSHKEMGIDSSRSPHTMKHFRQFLRSSYSLKKATAIKMRDADKRKPRLLIISRRRTRAFTNSGEIARMAKRLGYKVLVAEPDANITRVAQVVNSCDVLLGVHGAGLTNMVFLPENAILIQILPIGRFNWLARTDFGWPAKDMNIRYLDYEIQQQESTLIQQYPLDHAVFRDPSVIGKKGWNAWKSVYLEQQNVKLDVNRFRPTLLKALELLHQ
ncbi:hypothetical protein HS088_TW16G00457 [Tripterygium wilfordii]|uniref:Glycosyltransferase 61 catalytic domain-containing protein n=1 Tax=Tripterygium wilfordii TaxID=458696 RepID=A0A7J7CJ23_TRIWF|nr:beta-1,2-xylosyltransferase XYXT1-like [Tripterygium wilfordii]KAF5734016.1 hypothetical protein HS088_TW16G00457 [Tripterygium wilfordii]